MKTGRFVNTVTNKSLSYYGTAGWENLLSEANMAVLWNLDHSEVNYFLDDLAITDTVITPEFDGNRMIYANDTVIAKFETVKELLEYTGLSEKLKAYQRNNGHSLSNPLPEVHF